MRPKIHTLVVAFVLCAGGAASADETGLAGIHEWRRVGSKVCFTDHFHDGSGQGANQRVAMADAINSWQNFTALEYGSDWGSFAKATEKSASCKGIPTGIECNVHAIACKGGAAASTGQRRIARHRKAPN